MSRTTGRIIETDLDRSPTAPRVNERSLLTTLEVAEQLRVTPEQVRTLVRTGQLAAVNVGTGPKRPLYRITPDAVTEFLARRHQIVRAVVPRRRKPPTTVPDFFPNLK